MVKLLAAVWLSDKDQRNKPLDVTSLPLRITLYIILPVFGSFTDAYAYKQASYSRPIRDIMQAYNSTTSSD